MSEITTLDFMDLGRILQVAEKEVTPPFPNAKPMKQQVWDVPAVEKAIAYVKENYKKPGAKLALLGHVEIWICLALADALQPECECFFSVPNHDENNTFTNLPVYPVRYGEPDPALDYQHKVEEKGDLLFVDFTIGADIPWTQLLTETLKDLTVPALPENKLLCLASASHYPLQWVVMGNYAKTAKAVFTSDHGSPNYYCALSRDPQYKVGDVIVREK